MWVYYLGPCLLVENPALAVLPTQHFAPCCFLVGVSEEGQSGGEMVEGDVLVVEKARISSCTALV